MEADKPVMLGQFLAGEFAPDVNAGVCAAPPVGTCSNLPKSCATDAECVADGEPDDAGIGDPAFALAVPVEQLRDEYVFLVPNKYEENHLTIYAPTDASVFLSEVSLDGEAWESITDDWKVLHHPVPDGVHHLTGDQNFGVMVHGYDSYVSYAYPAGMNLGGLSIDAP